MDFLVASDEEPLDLSRTRLGSEPGSEKYFRSKSTADFHLKEKSFQIRNILRPKSEYPFPNSVANCALVPQVSPQLEEPEISEQPIRPILRTRGKERSLLACSVCAKTFDRPSLLKRHLRVHTGEKPNVCDVCSKGFSTSSSLNTHRRIHSGEKPHECPICGKRFTASSNLYYHRMTHNKEKPHKCLTCGKSFPTPGDLKSHQYVHSGTWPFNCPMCQRGFSKQTNLRNHILLHSGDKPHSCNKCDKKFALACNLRAHLKTHEEVRQSDQLSSGQNSKCLKCNRLFISVQTALKDRALCPECLEQGKLLKTKMFKGDRTPKQCFEEKAKMRRHRENELKPFSSAILPEISNDPSRATVDANADAWTSFGLTESSTNPFLEQLFAWNCQLLGTNEFLHQRFLEPSLFAAHLFSASAIRSNALPPFLPIFPSTIHDWSSEHTNKTQLTALRDHN